MGESPNGVNDPMLTELLRRLVQAYEPERVYLFGSRARGEGGPDSDYDLLLVVADDAPPSAGDLGWLTKCYAALEWRPTSSYARGPGSTVAKGSRRRSPARSSARAAFSMPPDGALLEDARVWLAAGAGAGQGPAGCG